MKQPAIVSSKSRLVLPAMLCLLPVVTFYFMLWRAARAVPMFDDYHAILSFVLRLRELPGVGAKLLYVLAAQHDEYKLVVEHAIVAADWALTGGVHFGFLILLGNVLVFGLGWLLWMNTGDEETGPARRLFLFAPVCYLLFQLNYVENLDWAMCCLQTMPVLFFTLACLHSLFRRGAAALVLACLCACLASLSSANGFLLAPIGFLLFAWRREWSRVAVWTATIVCSLCLYLYRYQPFVAPPTESRTGPGDKLLFLLSFLGAAGENMHHFPVRNGSVVVGLVLLLTLGFACFSRYPRAEPVLFSLAVWCLLSAIVVTQRRIIYGVNLSLTERYKVYSDLLLIVCYRIWVRRAGSHEARVREVQAPRARVVFATILCAAMIFCGVSDVFGYRYLARRQRRVAEGLNAYVADPANNPPEVSIMGEPFAGPEPEFTREVLSKSVAAGIYYVPPAASR